MYYSTTTRVIQFFHKWINQIRYFCSCGSGKVNLSSSTEDSCLQPTNTSKGTKSEIWRNELALLSLTHSISSYLQKVDTSLTCLKTVLSDSDTQLGVFHVNFKCSINHAFYHIVSAWPFQLFSNSIRFISFCHVIGQIVVRTYLLLLHNNALNAVFGFWTFL